MDLDLWALVLSVVGIAVPLFAFLWEFFFVGRKRLGYRVQLDTTARDEIGSEHAGVLAEMKPEAGSKLVHPSFVLVRIENAGSTTIDEQDYQVISDVKVGVRLLFPGRTVAGMVVTELEPPDLHSNFGELSVLGKGTLNNGPEPTGVVTLPRVPLNRGDHYKVLVVLERAAGGEDGPPKDPRIEAGVKGGRVKKTESGTGLSRRTAALMVFMALIIVGLGLVTVVNEDTPLDCAGGTLKLTGSTAIEAVMREAGDMYADTCPGAAFSYDFQGSSAGLSTLQEAGDQAKASPDVLAFSDGAKADLQPQLLPRPVAFLLFTLVVNKDAGVGDLTIDQVRRLYDGQIANWKDIGGNDVPVTLISRKPGSGTRTTFQHQILQGKREAATNSDNCRTRDSGGAPGIIRCERDRTDDLLNGVATVSGALGYAELGAATERTDLTVVRIDGQRATLEAATHGAYPFWETEFAYTYQEPKADSLAASFLRYLTNQVGKDIIRSHGNRPCDELDNPVLCRPA
ncbi:PstS family phosphate ABC transporter substrate-binding protein [Kibdelosporangium persicum]|uniref:Phosphate ABC transporter, periplasmic phosphate-binding protein PstS n=1 Tax=Kibdelosporangium persicum TaxID=2698649 RepID=A0ABX2FIB8_9PSEU|nr:substrate-binding domain-containing protein [Kibdelosporangium persicum]NRN71171.1 Phosphate ABC transporter, periplasmic phosphate-binding protein PstS [Kibdelosporangium persicum]